MKQEEKEETCEWTSGMNWSTSCGHSMSDEINYLTEDIIIFCCFCGEKIEWK
jgi:hypothetical protein